MHLLVRDARTLDEDGTPDDLGQTAADLVVLSFSDADLGALAEAWQAMPGAPSLRLASLGRLRHPMSVDLYLDQVVSGARCLVVRLLGGLDYWRYGIEEAAALCRDRGIALAVLPGDGCDDPGLAELSTVPAPALTRLDACFRYGGPANMQRAIRLAAHLAGLGPDDAGEAVPLPQQGVHSLDLTEDRPLAALVFYRSHLLSADIAPVQALTAALHARGLAVGTIYAASLKAPECAGWVAATLRAWRPAVVLNLTAFSARADDGPSPLDAPGAPVLQAVLAGSSRDAWDASSRGLTQADLAMNVALPELDGRLLTGAVSFKTERQAVSGLQYARTVHQPDPDGVALAADRAAGWTRLAGTPSGERRVAVVLSDYPGVGGQRGHAVGLDSFASLAAILGDLRDTGYTVPKKAFSCSFFLRERVGVRESRQRRPWTVETRLNAAALVLGASLTPTLSRREREQKASATALAQRLCDAAPQPYFAVSDYHCLFVTLPPSIQTTVTAAWGAPDMDPDVQAGAFTLRHLQLGSLTLAIQPGRGRADDRRTDHHDPDRAPRHSYLAFYLWLRSVRDVHAMVHLGTHGSLEWLPGKAVALSAACMPRALLGGLPVIYPFIVNNPGEAAAAKRRLGAVTIGHLTPPLGTGGAHGKALVLERLIDEYAAADGLDRRRTVLLRREILDRAETAGLLAESGAAPGDPDDETLARLDAYLCDVKDLQVRDGLHVYGRPPPHRARMLDALRRASPGAGPAALDACADAERTALLAALDGRFVPPGPAGAPTRGRADVLPTGRNLTTIDPRAVPTRSAVALAERAAAELLRRHLQDHGEHPRALMLNLWGSATMRTGGEDLALALVLMGVHPVWDAGSARVSGFEVLPLAVLDRPRVDVTLRISGLFRDAFAAQVALFDAAVRAVAERDEAADFNPLAGRVRELQGDALRRATQRVYGAPAGRYGAGSGRDTGAAWLAASAGAYGQGLDGAADLSGLRDRVRDADAMIHTQDHAEADLLDSTEHAAHEGGFAAAAAGLGARPALYHLDTSRPDAPRPRLVAEEVVRIVRGRAANPAWIAGMVQHGYRGAAEIARPVEALAAFAATLPTRFDAQFDLLHAATLGTPEVDAFLRQANPDARAAMASRFAAAQAEGLWHPRRNGPPDA
jgi:cobaltochelatase CobN